VAADIVTDFIAHEQGQGRPEAWLTEARDTVEDLLSFKIDIIGEPPLGFSADLVEEYLRDRFDEPGGGSDTSVTTLAEHVDAFFTWLAATDREAAPVARSIRAAIAAGRWAEARRDRGAPRSSTVRWTWSGDGPAPDPNEPCPCGSGVRYRKCCRPR
jgi:hypothetical protein